MENAVDKLYGSFQRQLGIYRELRDSVRTTMSKLVLSRGDIGVLIDGVDKKSKLLERVTQERDSVVEEIAYWQEHRNDMTNDRDAIALNETLGQMEVIITEFLNEEEKLKQYVERMFSKDGVQ